MFQVQQKRDTVLNRQILLLMDAMKGLRCDEIRKWWQDPLSQKERTRCQKYRNELNTLHKLNWEYFVSCYNGPGQHCDQEIPKLEARFGSWLDTLEESQAVNKASFKPENSK